MRAGARRRRELAARSKHSQLIERRGRWPAAANLTRRYPDWPVNRERDLVNGPTRWGREPLRLCLKKMVKGVLGLRPFREILFTWTWVLERLLPARRLLYFHYSFLVGLSWFRGYRRGLRRLTRSPGGIEAPEGTPIAGRGHSGDDQGNRLTRPGSPSGCLEVDHVSAP